MTKLERRLADIQPDTNSINADKEKLGKIYQDLNNQFNILDLMIRVKSNNGEDVTEYLSKQEILIKEMDENNVRLEYLLERAKKLAEKTINLLGNFIL